MSVQSRIDAIEDWIAGNIAGDFDHMALTVLLRSHLEGAFDDGVADAEKDFQHRIPWPTHERNEPL